MEEVLVKIDDMAHGGEGVGRLPDGRAIFVADVLPGETARVAVIQQRRRYARGRALEIVETSPDRIEAPCRYFGSCGGCQWQHMALTAQRRWKRKIVAGQLAHLGRIEDPPVEATRPVDPADGFGYRNHVTFAVDAEGRVAYHRRASKALVPVDECALLHPQLQDWHRKLPPLPGARQVELRLGVRTGQRLALVQGTVPEDARVQSHERGVPLNIAGHGEIVEMIGVERYRVSSKAFFQINTAGAETLVELVLEMLAPGPTDVAVDAYAGVGLFAIPLARRTERTWAVERSAASLRDLREHARSLPLHVIGTELEAARTQLPHKLDLVVADPPRAGLGRESAQLLTEMAPRRVVLVSCDPASLARDARDLRELGYHLARVVPVDMFPQTYHVECVSQFDRTAAHSADSQRQERP